MRRDLAPLKSGRFRMWQVGIHGGAEIDSTEDANLVAGVTYRQEVF